jgi:hypothetical protein
LQDGRSSTVCFQYSRCYSTLHMIMVSPEWKSQGLVFQNNICHIKAIRVLFWTTEQWYTNNNNVEFLYSTASRLKACSITPAMAPWRAYSHGALKSVQPWRPEERTAKLQFEISATGYTNRYHFCQLGTLLTPGWDETSEVKRPTQPLTPVGFKPVTYWPLV